MDFNELKENIGKAIDGAGVAVIVLGAVLAAGAFLKREIVGPQTAASYGSSCKRWAVPSFSAWSS
jgi:hypothetical protein